MSSNFSDILHYWTLDNIIDTKFDDRHYKSIINQIQEDDFGNSFISG